MKLILLALSLFALCSAVQAEAPAIDFDFKEVSACSDKLDPYLTPASLRAKRLGKHVRVVAVSSANCSAKVDGKVTFMRRAVSLALASSHSKNEPVAGCNCLRSFEFTLKRPISRGTVLYLVSDGDAVAHVLVP